MKKVLILFTIFLVVVSCNPPTNNPEDEPVNDPNAALAESDIGSSGGIIETEGITLTVPPGAFSSAVTISIFSGEASDNVFGDNAVTSPFRIEGLPEDFTKPVRVVLKYSGSLANEHYLAVGNELEVIESVDPVINTTLFEAKDSSGYLIADIEPPASSSSSEGSMKKGTSSVISRMLIMGLSNMSNYETPYFKLVHQFQADRVKIKKLAEYMDAAIDTFASMNLIDKSIAEAAIKEYGKLKVTIWGRNNEKYRGWCIDMPEFSMQTIDIPPTYGLYVMSYLVKIKFSISENVLIVSSEEEIRSLAFAWVYRMCCFSHAGSHQDWFTYGSTLWMQEKYSGVAEYDVNKSPDLAMSPLAGIESGKSIFTDTRKAKTVLGGELTVQEENYSYSMVPFIKYLDLTYAKDKSLISRILTETIFAQSGTPAEGIVNALEDPEYIWFPGFCKAYLTRELYNISYVHFQDKIHSLDQLDFYDEVDTILYSEEDYADLSAHLYSVNLLMPEFKDNATLNLKLGPSSLNLDYVTAMAFGLRNGELEYFDHASDLTITNLAGLKYNNYHSIVILVINSANEPPFNESITIDLDTEMRIVPKDFNWVIFRVVTRANYTYTDGSSTTEGDFYYADANLRRGALSNNRFTATWNEPLSDGTSSGNITIVFDPDQFPRYITGYSVTETRKLSDTRTFTITAENIKLQGYRDYDGSYLYTALGEDTRDFISYINEEYSGSDGYGYATDGVPVINDDSYIEIVLGPKELE